MSNNRVSCIAHPSGDYFVIVRQWQIAACDGNACAAALLSFFESWHNTRRDTVDRDASASLWQNHTEKEIESGIFFYKRTAISEGIKILEEKGFIEQGKNPDRRYSFDRTRFFLFKPEVVNGWLNSRNGSPSTENSTSTNQKRFVSDQPKTVEQYSISPNTQYSNTASPKNAQIDRPKPTKTQVAEIYDAYPKHVGRAAALKAIEKNLKDRDPDEILAIVKLYADKIRAEGKEQQFIPHPTTWFNQGRFDDDDLKPPLKVKYVEVDPETWWGDDAPR
jgi:hypothetical protein